MRNFYRLTYDLNKFLHKIGLTKIPLVSQLYSFGKGLFFSKDASMPLQYVTSRIGHDQFCIPRLLIKDYLVGDFESFVKHVLKNNLRPGNVLVDVGANIGALTVFASKLVGPAGKIYAIEPGTDNLYFLRKNISINNIRNVTIVPYAAGPSAGSRNFYHRLCGTLHSFYPDHEDGQVITNTVRQVPLDDIVKDEIDIVKMDVEGAEIEVLQGMQTIMNKNPNLKIIAEWNPSALERAGYSPTDLPETLLGAGYQLSVVEEGRHLRNLQEASEYLTPHCRDERWYVNLLAWKEV